MKRHCKKAMMAAAIVFALISIPSGLTGKTLTRNWVKTITFLDAAGTDSVMSTVFYDGLGRECLRMDVEGSPQKADIVTSVSYNSLGLPWRRYIPGTSALSGAYPDNISYPTASLGEERVYSETEYEAACSHRPTVARGPGDEWTAQGAAVTTEYMMNTASAGELQCRCFSVDFTPETGWQFKLHDEGLYDDCELSVARTTDEDGNVTLTFTDFAGQTVLSRRVLDGAYLDTYYVYDDAGNLTAVIPPMGVESMVGNGDEWDPDTGYVWSYFYAYDYLHRVVKKQLPGCGPVEYRYRGTATVPYMWRDANMREKGVWRFTVPDIFGRPCLEGTCSGFTPDRYNSEGPVLARMAEKLSDSAHWCGYYIDGGAFTDMKVTKARYYGNRRALSFFRTAYKQRTGRELYPDLGYLPLLPGPKPDGSIDDPEADCKGREALTVTSCPADSGDMYLLSLNFYDTLGRLVSVRSTNHIGGTDRIDYSYDFAGRLTGEDLTHSSPWLPRALTVRKAHTYDRAGRLLATSLSVDGHDPVVIVSNTYDDTGRLIATGPDVPCKAITFFDYNIRSWPVTVYADCYMQELDFTPGGNVRVMRWRAEGDTAVRRYDFAYDGLGRLTSARYGAGTGAQGNYDTDYTYDAHGNILTLQRKGLHDGGRFALIDDLYCTYDGNRLVQVSDAATAPTYKDAHHFVDTKNWSVSGGDYDYDRCGNMVHDRNRGLTYRYDLNHQPCAIGTRGLTKRLRYTDDGVKVHEHYDYPPYFAEPSLPGSTDVTDCLDYCGDVTYRDGRLHSLSFGGGYLTFAGDSVSGCRYFVSDHLGNVRAVVSDADSVEQVNHYYPFGILMGESRGGDVQRRKFGGKELDREWGLDLFDFEARRFDGMRFTQPDPLAEKYPDTSPYAFCLNNPLRNSDPTGMDIFVLNKGNGGMHMAMLIQNKDGKWQYYSINGDNKYSSGRHTGGRPFNDIAVGSWNSPQEFLNSEYNATSNDKEDRSVNSYDYAEGYQIETSPEQDEYMSNEFTKISNTEYNFLTNNCATAVQRVMVGAGIPVSKPKDISQKVSLSTPFGIVEVSKVYKIECKINCEPNIAFKSIRKWNPGGTYLHK